MDFINSASFLEKMIEENKEDKELVKELLLAYRNLMDKTAEMNIENIKANTNFNIENNKNNMTFSIAQYKENTNFNIEWNKLQYRPPLAKR